MSWTDQRFRLPEEAGGAKKGAAQVQKRIDGPRKPIAGLSPERHMKAGCHFNVGSVLKLASEYRRTMPPRMRRQELFFAGRQPIGSLRGKNTLTSTGVTASSFRATDGLRVGFCGGQGKR